MKKSAMRWHFASCIFLLCHVLMSPSLAHAEQKMTVFAAASLSNVITELAAQYQQSKNVRLQSSFAASSALAKQIENGAPADLFISADKKWMDYLQGKKLVDSQSRIDLLRNELVLIAPEGKAFKAIFNNAFDLSKAFSGKLCTGEVASVPVGIYAKQALTSLTWWQALRHRIVGTQDVWAALVFVERSECAAGIVYATDASASTKVHVIGTFPADTHDPIVYPAALVNGASAEAKAFLLYLQSDQARRIFTKYGFMPIKGAGL